MRQNQLWIVGGVVLAFLLAYFAINLDSITVEPDSEATEASLNSITPK
jgi:hypothetical protein